MANLAIFNGLLQPPKSVADYDMQAAQLQGQQLQNTNRGIQNQTATLGNQKTQVDLDRSNQLLALSKGLPAGASDLDRLSAMRNAGFYDQADALSKSIDDRAKSTAAAAKDTASAGETSFKTQQAKKTARLQALSSFNNPDDAKAHLAAGVADGSLSMADATQMIQKVPTDPAEFPKWQLATMRALLTPEQQTKLTTPDANAKLQATTSTANTAATNATHEKTAALTQAGENSRAALGRQTQMTIAGVNPGGGLDENGERTAQGIATGQLQPPTGVALLNPKNQRILGRVLEINPQYDSTTVTAKKKAASDFTTGTLGNSMRSFAVAGQHLDQLNTLVDALDNGNLPIINKVANTIAQQTGNPAPTNFNAAKDIVSKEVIKAIVAGGGGVNERKELADLMKDANAPKQLKGVIQQYRNLMSAQHEALLQQRDAAGLPRSTLPNYTDANGSPAAAPAAPSGFKIISVK